jgi:hypothetical protein
MVMLRRVGLVIGSLVIAWLAVGLVAGVLFGRASVGSAIVAVTAVVLGAYIYLEIRRREANV